MLRFIRDCLGFVIVIGLVPYVIGTLHKRSLPLAVVIAFGLVIVGAPLLLQIRNKCRYGKVLAREYVPKHSVRCLGVCGVSAVPGAVVIPGRPPTYQTVPDEWSLLIKNDYGQKRRVAVSKDDYTKYVEGEWYQRYRL